MDRKDEKSTQKKALDHVSEETGTIFDDVFRTIAEKMPCLLIPLINEVFGTDYGEDQELIPLRNEYLEKTGKIVTDSIFQIEHSLYHMECQSAKDGRMAIRMIEYDFAIAVEHFETDEDGTIEMDFPESCVLYIRNHRNMPKQHKVRLRFPENQTVVYQARIIMAQDYTVDRIFEKKLLLLLPYHILRYEHFLKTGGTDQDKVSRLVNDFTEIVEKLYAYCGDEERSGLYADLIGFINQIATYIIPESNPMKKRLGDIMGGKVLTLLSETIKQEGRQEGRLEGRLEGRQEGRLEGRQDQSRKTVLLVYRSERSIAKAALYGDVSEEQAYAWLKEASMI